MKIYLDNNLGVTNVEQEELTQDTIGYNILKVYIPNAVLTPYDTFTCYYGALLQNGRKVGWFAMEARTSTDADYEENYTLYKATLEQCVVSVEGKVYIGCQVLLGNSGNATLIKKNTAVVQFNVRKSVAINNDILVLDTDQTTTDVLESYKNLLENALLTYATKATTYTKTQVDSAFALKADKATAITHTGSQLKDYSGNNVYPNINVDSMEKGLIPSSKLNPTGILYSTTNSCIELKKGIVDGSYNFRFIGYEYPQASINESTGEITTGTAKNRSFTYLLEIDDVVSFTVASGYIVRCYAYDSSKAYLNRIKGDTNGTTYSFSFASNVKYIRFSITTASYVLVTPEELYANLYVSINLTKFNSSYRFANEYKDFTDNILYYDIKEFNSGNINTSTGAVGSGSALVSEMIPYDRIQYISYKSGYIMRLGLYEYDGTFIKTQQITTSSNDILNLPHYINILTAKRPYYVRFSIWNNDYTTPSIETIKNNFKFYTTIKNNQRFIEEIPSYFKNNLNTALNSIKSNIEEVGRNGETFIFITDIHWENNAKHSPSLIKFLMDNLHLNNVIFGGDLINGSTSDKNVAFNTLKNAFYSYSFLGKKFKSVFGNHDTNQANNSNDTSLWLSDNEYYATIQKIFDEDAMYGSDDEKYYYVDVKGTKTRYICLDTGVNRTISQNQLDWCEGLLQLNDGYKVIVVAHMIYTAYNDLTTNSDIDALFTLLDTYASKVQMIICGHSHIDYNSTTTGGIPVIMVDCDGLSTHSADATVGTINEQCFDVVTVNYDNGTIKCVRIGRGNSRTITRS